MNNNQLAHLWAQQTKSEGHTSRNKNGLSCYNFSFRGRSLYSYHTEIARFVKTSLCEKVVIYTLQTYSVTTTGKHKFTHAIRQYQSFGVYCHLRELSDDWEEIKIAIARTISISLSNEIESLKKTRAYVTSSINSIINKSNKLINFLDTYFEDSKNVKDVIDYPILIALFGDTDNALKTFYNIDTEKKREQEIKHDEKESEKRRIRNEEWNRWNRRLNDVQETQKLAIEEWINGKGYVVSKFYGQSVKLRIKGDTVETSHGANVPLEHAIKFYERIKDLDHSHTRYNIQGIRIGHFTVDKIENNIAFIGCHQIPLDEMERVYLLHKGIIQTKPVIIDQASA